MECELSVNFGFVWYVEWGMVVIENWFGNWEVEVNFLRFCGI